MGRYWPCPPARMEETALFAAVLWEGFQEILVLRADR